MDDGGATTEHTFASYLAKALIARKGYRPGTVPEARALFAHCDAVLTLADGLTLAIVAIVDRQANPSRRFSLGKEALDKIGTDCQRYTGSTAGRKLPVHVTVIETGASPVQPEDKERLALLKSKSPFSKVLISAVAADLSTRALWTNAPFSTRTMRWFIKGLMARPQLADADLSPKPVAAQPEDRPLNLTYGLLAALLAVFACEYVFRVGASSGLMDPGVQTLAALGALAKLQVLEDGQWWRLFTAPLLHGGLIHIAFNGIALYFAGAVLENVIGRAWFAGVFAVSAVTGSAMSLLMNPDSLISVGASGAIMGLFAAAFAVAYRYPEGSPMRNFLISGSLRVLIPSMLPLFGGLTGEKIDYAAHMGGAIGGAAVGAFLVLVWRREAPLPPLRALGWALAAAFLCCAAYGGVQVAKGYAEYDLSSNLIPAREIPKDTEGAMEKSASLVASYPHDPRAHMYRALALIDAGDRAGAEREWQAALSEDEMLRTFFKPELEEFIRANLAGAQKENGKQAEAIETAKPVCAKKNEIRDELAKKGLCPS
jgi:rhomboid protease GluP